MKELPITTEKGRYFLTDHIRDNVDFRMTAQSRGLRPPPAQKKAPDGYELIALPPLKECAIPACDLSAAIAARRSRRSYTAQPLTLEELSYLLWATQGVRATLHEAAVLRTVPSAGCRHAFETYLAITQVTGLASGLYRYLPLDHALVCLGSVDNLRARLSMATRGQDFTGRAATTFIWSAVPARMEWRYGEASYKVIAIDVGHVCQNLYLACEAIGCGTCAIAAYDQARVDELLGVDGVDEFGIYLAPVGKLSAGSDD